MSIIGGDVQEAQAVYLNAIEDAMMWGLGIIVVQNTPSGISFSHVPREQHLALADDIKKFDDDSKRRMN